MNIHNYKLVQFPSGAYGVRKGRIFHEYYCFNYECCRRWFELDQIPAYFCYTHDRVEAGIVHKLLTEKGDVL